MPFFAERPPEPTPPKPQRRTTPEWWRPPRDAMPVTLPIARSLVRGQEVSLHLRRIDVYREGLSLELQLDLRRLDDDDDGDVAQRFHRSASALRLGVTLADGTSASTGVRGDWVFTIDPNDAPPQPHLSFHGGGGGGDAFQYTQTVAAWLWPLPPDGPLTLHFEAPGLGIDEDSVVVDLELASVVDDVTSIWAG